ncbi:MAG: hypothetical protein ACOYJD_03475 [Christensenellales bacterium]|jgi:hypothetical protein
MLSIKECAELVRKRISSRKVFTEEDKETLYERWGKIHSDIISENMLLKETAKEILEYVYFMEEITMRGLMFTKSITAQFPSKFDIKMGVVKRIEADPALTADEAGIGKFISQYNDKKLPQFLLGSHDNYIRELEKALRKTEQIPKIIMPYLVRDYIYFCRIYDACKIIGMSSEASNRSEDEVQWMVDIIEDLGWKKVLSQSLIDRYISELAWMSITNNEYIKTATLVSCLDVIFSLGGALVRFDRRGYSLDTFASFKDSLIGVIDNA